jgi:arginase
MLRIIGVPVDSSGAPSPGSERFGTERGPADLRAAGLVEVLDAVDAGDVAVRIHRSDPDPDTGVLSWDEVANLTEAVRAAVVETLHAGDLPVVVGGCASLLPGALAGARDALGIVSLAYTASRLRLDRGTSSSTGRASDMALAVA